jgi:hypothetical protein
MVFLVSIVLSGCMYLMEEDPWEHQRKMDERERIRKEQEMQKKQSTTIDTNSPQQN